MAGDTTITVVGNLTADPELRFTPSGAAVANFTVASTPRIYDRQSGEWKDGEALFLRCNIWREAAENVAESLTRGARVITRLAGGSPELMGKLDPILQRHRVPLYLNGHDHNLAHVFHGSTHFVCTGAGSKLADHCDLNGSDFCALRSGFTACAVNRNRLRVAYRDYTGTELHVVDIPRPA